MYRPNLSEPDLNREDLHRLEWNDSIYIDYILSYKDEIYIDPI